VKYGSSASGGGSINGSVSNGGSASARLETMKPYLLTRCHLTSY